MKPPAASISAGSDDEPARAPHAPTELTDDQRRSAMWYATVAWLFGSMWMTAVAGAPLTQYAESLRATEFEFGVLAALPFLASLLSLPASLLTERTGQRKRVFLFSLYAQRLLWIAIALVPLWLVTLHGMGAAPRAMFVFLALIFVMHCGQAFGSPAWMSWMADLVPDRVRGKYFARRRQWGILTAVPTALIVGWAMDRYAPGGAAEPLVTMRTCAVIFIAAALVGILDIALFHPIPHPHKPPRTGKGLLRAMVGPLRDKSFMWFAGMVATLVFAVSFMGQFVNLYLLREVRVSNANWQIMILVVPALAQLIVLPIWGRAADRMGKKPVLKLSALGFAPVALGWCFLHSGNVWLGYTLSAVGVALWTGVEIANFNIMLEMAGTKGSTDPNRGSSYVAVNIVIVNLAGAAGGFASGAIAEWLEHWRWTVPVLAARPVMFYDVLFVLSAVLRVLAVVIFLPHIHEPEARPTREALRFITANVYSNLQNAVLQPIRLVRATLGAGSNDVERESARVGR